MFSLCGVDDPASVVDNGGVGLRNVRERFAQMYKGTARLVARITMPFATSPSGDSGSV